MDFYLIDPGGPQLQLPVNPGEVTIRREKQYETTNIINLGEVDFPTGEKVKEISFSSFFPVYYDSSYCSYQDIPDPQEAMNQLTSWAMGRSPVRLIITNTIINVLILVAAHISTFKGGEPGDVYYDLTCRTWREIKVRTTAEAAAPADIGGVAANESRPDLKPVPMKIKVKPGDSLWAIAKLQYGDGGRWREIYEANKDIIGPDPTLIASGIQLVVPA
ncbi:Peptidoglycan-binding LysM [Desulfofarcimen acetoxidans DSM 771]|uniref:Peptidoglycan-binding LysM n=1 Tax=Desulfofarcimen acetoxidans (strain ATCC 49208 / DSM 771 / KCTC 5769 / VKM B-1644 / 5575) TaxID=485916 RepID=C8VZG8_DESAS|nr:LysM peptidoglycan-binding domain-containing protein [Desulfofarcimen acetoxidans]ACV64913.1 Peptidoglycan-binding LysM [Desulfofarcimen acetoxidans DSM 771]